MENNIPRNTPALLGTILPAPNKKRIARHLRMEIARIDQIRNSLFNRFEKLLKQAQVGNEEERASVPTTKRSLGMQTWLAFGMWANGYDKKYRLKTTIAIVLL